MPEDGEINSKEQNNSFLPPHIIIGIIAVNNRDKNMAFEIRGDTVKKTVETLFLSQTEDST